MTKRQRQAEFYTRMERLGISFDDVESLRRIEMTLSRWGEAECNGEIQRDEVTSKPYRHCGENMDKRYQVPDKEKGALARLAKIVAKYPAYEYYYQTDPRGCSLYLVAKKDIPEGKDIDAYYTRGYAVCY